MRDGSLRTIGNILVLTPRDQVVERVNVWRKAEGDPTDGAPKNDSVTHRHSPSWLSAHHSSPMRLNTRRLRGGTQLMMRRTARDSIN